jgi:transposase-like protein
MERERTEYINAEDYERTDNRVTSRNGYYDRAYLTRVGNLELKVPRTRDGKFSPSIFEKYQRNEKALLASMLEMYVSGVSTRKVTNIIEELCGKSVSKSFVSSLTKELDEMVEAWRNSSLEGTCYPYLMVDVLFIKVRENHRVVSKSCHVAIGITEGGTREIIGFLIQDTESEESWSNFFDHLKSRDLKGLKMVISDAHKGLVNAIKASFPGISWQRCQVHFLRNILSSVPKKDSKIFREQVKAIFRLTNIDAARTVKNLLIESFEGQIRYEKACRILDEGFEDAFQYSVNGIAHPRLRSTNLLERLNAEIRRREKVIRIFPNVDSATRLIGAVLIDQQDKWLESSKAYIKI